MNRNIKKLINEYINDVIEGYSIIVSKKYQEDDAEIIVYALEKLQKKLNNNINQRELMSRINKITSKNITKTCKSDEILNTKTNRCVKKNGPTGKKLLKKNNI